MSPQKPKHGHAQARITEVLSQLIPRTGRRAVEFAIETPKGVKLPDFVWISEERWSGIPEDAEASLVALEICIEVLPDSNTAAEIDEKCRLYFIGTPSKSGPAAPKATCAFSPQPANSPHPCSFRIFRRTSISRSWSDHRASTSSERRVDRPGTCNGASSS